MIKISEIKEGDYVLVNNEGAQMEGEVIEVNGVQKMANILTNGQQEFWYGEELLSPIPLSDSALLNLNFQRQEEENGGVKYLKGAFRVHLDKKDDFSNIYFWYREDRRHIHEPISVHQLQNFYLSMTKVHLTAAPI